MMIPNELLTILGRRRFIAEVRTDTARQALGVIESLARGGLTAFEISVAIPGCEEILHHFATSNEIIVGAGGITEARFAEEVARAGAHFISSPITCPELIPICIEHHVMPILGALTPTEIVAAQRAGAEVVKIFPISAMGGGHYIRSLYRQFTHLSVMVSGGVTLETLPDYLALPLRAICLSSTLVPRVIVERGDWHALTQIARHFVEYARQWELGGQNQPRTAANGLPIIGDTTMNPSVLPPPVPTSIPARLSQSQAAQPYPAQSQVAQPYLAQSQAAQPHLAQSQAAQPIPQRSQPAQPQPVSPPSMPPEPEHDPFTDPFAEAVAPDSGRLSDPSPESFKPWDSRPVGNMGNKDDWIR
jgi:2-dehydro-3-deoxyphosphogluconate aldolase / (4S)-4-hydroxy-2-oxoglutarate aldolase